jgi:DNA-binding transcriptional regulator YhcF (GntR family)
MIWTDQVLKEAERLTAANTTAEIASVYGVKPCTLRKAFSQLRHHIGIPRKG